MMPDDVIPLAPNFQNDAELIQKFDQSIIKLDSLIEAGKQAKGKGKLGLIQGRFVSSAYNTESSWKVMRWAGNLSESVDRTWKRLNSDQVFNELERLTDELALEIQETGDRLQPGSAAFEKFNTLKTKIAEAKEQALKPLLDYYKKNLKVGDAKSQRYYLRCKSLEAQFDVERLKESKVELKVIIDHSRTLSKLLKSKDSKEAVGKAIDKEIAYITANPETIRKFSQENGIIWKDYLATLSKISKIDETKGPELFETLISVLRDQLPPGSCTHVDNDPIASIRHHLNQGVNPEARFKELLRNHDPENLMLLTMGIAAGVWDPQAHLHLLTDQELNPQMVEELLRDFTLFDVDIDEKNGAGQTLLHRAIEALNVPLIAQLLEMDARIDIENSEGASALDYAFLLNGDDNANAKVIAGMIFDAFETRFAEKIANPIDMSFKPTKLKENIGTRGQKNKREKYLDKTLEATATGFEIIEGGFAPVASLMNTSSQLSKLQKQRALIDLEIKHKEQKLQRPNLDDQKFHRLMVEISELEDHKKMFVEAGKAKNDKKVAGTTGDAISFATGMLEGTESEVLKNLLPGVELVTGSLKIYKQIKGIENEARKLKLVNQIIESLVKDVEILGNLVTALERSQEPFKARVMALKKLEVENKIRFLVRQRRQIENESHAKMVSTGATTVKTIGKIGSAFIPGLGLVIGAASLMSYAPTVVSGVGMAKDWGKLKEEHFEPFNPSKTTKATKKQIARRLGIASKNVDQKLIEVCNGMSQEDKVWLKSMLIKAGVLAETDKEIPEDKLPFFMAALVID